MSRNEDQINDWIDFMTHMANTADKEIVFSNKEVIEMAHDLKTISTTLKHMYSHLPDDVVNKLHAVIQKLLSRTN